VFETLFAEATCPPLCARGGAASVTSFRRGRREVELLVCTCGGVSTHTAQAMKPRLANTRTMKAMRTNEF
jgi:hypothetical protein